MKPTHKLWLLAACLAAVFSSTAGTTLWSLSAQPKPGAPALTGSPRKVEVRGHVVCLAEEMNRLHQVELKTAHEHLYGFRTTDGTYYTLLRVKTSEALFLDPKVRAKELILTGRVFPNSNLFEPATMRSVVGGRVNDLFYWCNICSIHTIAPGECLCCHEPVELTEKPIGESNR